MDRLGKNSFSKFCKTNYIQINYRYSNTDEFMVDENNKLISTIVPESYFLDKFSNELVSIEEYDPKGIIKKQQYLFHSEYDFYFITFYWIIWN